MEPGRKVIHISSGTATTAAIGSGGGAVSTAIPISVPVDAKYGIFVWRYKHGTGGANYISAIQLANWNPVTSALSAYASYGSNFFKTAGVTNGSASPGSANHNGVPVTYGANSSNSGISTIAFSNLSLADIAGLNGATEGRGVGFEVKNQDSVRFAVGTQTVSGSTPIVSYVWDFYLVY